MKLSLSLTIKAIKLNQCYLFEVECLKQKRGKKLDEKRKKPKKASQFT